MGFAIGIELTVDVLGKNPPIGYHFAFPQPVFP